MPVEHCRYGHELTLQNTQLMFSVKGNYQYRRCRTCFDLTDDDVAHIEKHLFEDGGSIRTLDLPAAKAITFKECEKYRPAWWKRIKDASTVNARLAKTVAARKFRAEQTRCKHGHLLSGDNVQVTTRLNTGRVQRVCLTCRNARQKMGNYTPEQIATVTDCITNNGMTIADVVRRIGDRPRIIKFEALQLAMMADPELDMRLRAKSAKNAKKHRTQTWKAKKVAAEQLRKAARVAEREVAREQRRLAAIERSKRRKFFPADTFMRLLEEGLTPQMIYNGRRPLQSHQQVAARYGTKQSFQNYCAKHPEWGVKANELIARNSEVAQHNKGTANSFWGRTHCARGHELTPENVGFHTTRKTNYCIQCNRFSANRGGLMSAERIRRVESAIASGMSLGDICSSRKTTRFETFAAIKRTRLEKPEFDRFIIEHSSVQSRKVLLGKNGITRIDRSTIASIPIRAEVIGERGVPLYVAEAGDFEWFYSLTPRYLSEDDRLDVVSNIYLALHERRVRREDVPNRIKEFTKQHTSVFSTGEYGSAKSPYSLDAAIFEDGKTTRGDNAHVGLWSEESIYA